MHINTHKWSTFIDYLSLATDAFFTIQ